MIGSPRVEQRGIVSNVEIKIDSETLKSPAGIAVGVLVLVIAIGWVHMRRASLIREGTQASLEYLESELPLQYSRDLLDTDPGAIDPAVLQSLGQVEILEFSPSYFFRAGKDSKVRVRVKARANDQEFTYYFYFKSILGTWKLHAGSAPPLFDPF